MAQYLSKEQVVERICNRTNDIQKLKDEIDIDNYVEVKPKNVKGIYGVNVRLKGDVDILPFISKFGIDSFDTEKVAEEVKLYIPFFIKEKEISEIKFECKVQDEDGRIESLKVKTCKDLKGNDKTVDEEIIKNWLNQPNTFLRENIKALRYSKGEEIYVWITGEDYDPETNGTSFLSNTLAIFNDEDVLDKTISKRLDIVYFLFLLKSRYLAEMDLRRKIAAEKSAKAAIMSRNMSHNLGSHVMAYLKQKLGSVSAILKEENRVLSNLYVYKDGSINDTQGQDEIEMPFLVGLGRFIGYLQERQDYIATIATDYIPYGAPVNMKDAIYDELNPDLRHLRHNMTNEKDQNMPFNVLLSYIAKSEGLSRENMNTTGNINDTKSSRDILLGYIRYGETPEEEPHIFGFEPQNSVSDDPALTELRTINFSLPGGLVGRQAVFSVVENLIRNAAKHGDTTKVENLTFLFDVIDGAKVKDGSLVRMKERLSDDTFRELYASSNDIEELYLLSITDNLAYSSDLASKTLAPGLIEDYIDSAGQMTTSNKGIKEIRISAAWLRSDVNETNYLRAGDDISLHKKAPLVAIEITKEGHLRYIVALHKNKRVAYIEDGLDPKATACLDVLREQAPNDWYKFSTAENFLQDKKSSFAYVIVSNEAVYNAVRPDYSNRVFIWSPSEEQKSEIEKLSLTNTYSEALQYQIETIIYKSFTGIEDANTPIYIWDKKTFKAHDDNEESKKELIIRFNDKKSIVIFNDRDGDEREAQYVYRTHHATVGDFRSFYEKKKLNGGYSQIRAVDAVTGDNSSDRLVRREPLNEEWYYSHLRALQKRVAIFDERLFRIIHNVDETLFISGDGDLAEKLKQVKAGTLSVDEVMEKINNYDEEFIIPFFEQEYLNEKFNLGVLTSTLLYDTLIDLSRHFTKQEVYGNHQSAYQRGKGVDIFTIIKEKQGEFAIVGCTEDTYENQDFKCTFDKIGRIYLDDNEQVKIEFITEDYKDKYNYITIHQGILDKIYEGVGIKKLSDENNKAKCEVTKAIFKELMVKENHIIPKKIIDNEHKDNLPKIYEYLPNFIIHSGRAKPAVDDMPQKQPFVQFAAIENAVKDCKYSLIQLLDYARYEE